MHGCRSVVRSGVPGWPVLAAVAIPATAFCAATVLAPPSAETQPGLLAAFVAILFSLAAIGWFASTSEGEQKRIVTALGVAGLIIVFANLVSVLLGSAFYDDVTGTRFAGLLERPNTVGVLSFAVLPFLVGAWDLSPRQSAWRAAFGLGVLRCSSRRSHFRSLEPGSPHRSPLFWFTRTCERGGKVAAS